MSVVWLLMSALCVAHCSVHVGVNVSSPQSHDAVVAECVRVLLPRDSVGMGPETERVIDTVAVAVTASDQKGKAAADGDVYLRIFVRCGAGVAVALAGVEACSGVHWAGMAPGPCLCSSPSLPFPNRPPPPPPPPGQRPL